MHKLFWCGVMLTAMVVAAVCLVIDYSQRYPDSPMGRCTQAACRVAMALDPVFMVAPRVGQAGYHVMATVAQSVNHQSACCPPKEEACAAAADEPKPVPPLDVIDLSLSAVEAGGAEESSTPEPVSGSSLAEPAQTESDEAVTVPPMPIEDEAAVEEDPVPDTMPPATDQDEDSEANPKMEDLIQEAIEEEHQLDAAAAGTAEQAEALPMPHEASQLEQSLNMTCRLQFDETPLEQVVENLRCLLGIDIVIDQPALDKEGVARDWPISIELEGMPMKAALHAILDNFNLTYLVKDDALLITTECGARAAATDAQDGADHCTASGCYPVKDEAVEQAAASREEDLQTWEFWKTFFHFDKELATSEDAAEEVPMPAEASTEEQPASEPPAAETPGGEESEALPGTPPDCREDPHHDQQYPGCPYMGGCPGVHYLPPAAPADSDSPPKTKKKKKTADAQPDMVEDTAIRRMKYEEFALPAGERPVRADHFDWLPAVPKVDTMEFRRSDAKPGEFDEKPF